MLFEVTRLHFLLVHSPKDLERGSPGSPVFCYCPGPNVPTIKGNWLLEQSLRALHCAEICYLSELAAVMYGKGNTDRWAGPGYV